MIRVAAAEPVSDAPVSPALSDVHAARRRIADAVLRTPLERSTWLSEWTGREIYLKLECWQRTRSFKVRGATNAIRSLPEEARLRGVVAASAGNHGQAVALAAAAAAIPCTIFVPSDAPQLKKARILAARAGLEEGSATYDDAERAAATHAAERGAFLVHAFSDPLVVAGQATVGLEIVEDLPDVREVVVPVGGGGLAGGIGRVLRATGTPARLIGIQSTRTVAMYEALRAGRVVETPITPTLADGLAGCTDEPAFRLVRGVLDELHLVEESAIAAAIRDHLRHDGIVVEGAAAVAAAALITIQLELRGPTVLVVSGGNIGGERLAALITADRWPT